MYLIDSMAGRFLPPIDNLKLTPTSLRPSLPTFTENIALPFTLNPRTSFTNSANVFSAPRYKGSVFAHISRIILSSSLALRTRFKEVIDELVELCCCIGAEKFVGISLELVALYGNFPVSLSEKVDAF